MVVAKYEIEKVDGKCDFGLWKAKIKVILGQQKADRAIQDSALFPNSNSIRKIRYRTNSLWYSCLKFDDSVATSSDSSRNNIHDLD